MNNLLGTVGVPSETVQRHALGIAQYLALLFLFDLVIRQTTLGKVSRWKSIHAVANIVISALSAQDAWRSALDPAGSCSGGVYSLHPCYAIAALHLYHMLPFLGFKLTRDDYFHHVVFGGIICSVGLLFETGPLQNLVAFFICGLPGGLDYIMLCAVKLGYLKKEEEKIWNARINVWVRSPGLLASAFSIYAAMLYGDPTTSTCKQRPAVAITTAAVIVLNGQYYLQVVVGNTFRKVETYNS